VTDFDRRCRRADVALWQQGLAQLPFLPFLNFDLSEKFLPKVQNSALKIPNLSDFFWGGGAKLTFRPALVTNLQLFVGTLSEMLCASAICRGIGDPETNK